MIAAVITAAAGVLAGAAAALLLWKKKLSGIWGGSLLVCALILVLVGSMGAVRQAQNRTAEYGYIYMALCYMEEGQTDPAALYLKRAGSQTGYHLTAAQVLLEQLRGNDTVAQLRLDVLENTQDGSNAEKSLAALQTWDRTEDGLRSVTVSLRGQLPLSDRRKKALDQSFALEIGRDPGNETINTENALLLQVNRSLGYGDWYGALSGAVELVREEASESNRLLLAEVIADVTYSGTEIRSEQFSYDQQTAADTYARESEKLMTRYAELTDELAELQLKMDSSGEEEGEALADQSAQLAEEAESVQRQAENIFAMRALNSIADIHSLEAQVVRARLYYAMRSYQEAVDTLRSSAGSLQAGLSGNRTLVRALQMVDKVYESEDEVGADTPEFREELQVLLGSVHPELIQLGLTPLARDFAERIISDQKTYGSGLYVVGLDAGSYPEIRVRLGGQSELLDTIISREKVVVNDTRTTVDTYEVEYDNTQERLNSICFVIDTSGSMGGTPIEDAREALNRFLDEISGNVELALVKFESSAETLAELTMSIGTLKTEVSSLGAGGGTDITAGIKAGTAALGSASGARTMIMMTDGQSSVDMNAVQEAADQGITIFTIGFGSVNDELLQSIADMTGGQYLRADSSTELMNVYSSLQGIIGNTVTLTYTVENTEETERYFFLNSEEHNCSVRREYDIEQEETEEEPAVTLTSQPAMWTRAYLDQLAERESAFRISYYGTGLDTVTAARAGDESCVITDQAEDYIELEVSTRLPNGIYEIGLTAQSGEEYGFPGMLVIGDELRCWNYRAGSLQISANQALMPEEDMIVLGSSMQISEVQTESGELNTLSLRLDGMLAFDGVELPAEAADENGGMQLEELDLGDTGLGQGYGTLYVGYDDRAYADYVDSRILEGAIRVEYDVPYSRFAAGEEEVQ